MSAAQLTKAMEKASTESSKITRMMIDAGRGNEYPSDMMKKSDPLSLKYQKSASLLQNLYAEKSRRITYSGTMRPIKYQENPTMATKKFSPAQIAAQKLFAERARAGTLGQGKRKANPDKSKPRAYVKRASQITGAPPSKRLVSRRKMALSAPAGYFPNPSNQKLSAIDVDFLTGRKNIFGEINTPSEKKAQLEFLKNSRMTSKPVRSKYYNLTARVNRKTNPAAAMMTGYQVICMHPRKHVVGIFKTMAEAKLVARAMADAKGVPYAVKTVKVHKAHFAV